VSATAGPDLTPNYAETERYLEALIGPDWATTTLTWQTFDDNQDRRDKAKGVARLTGKRPTDPFARVQAGVWDKVKQQLTLVNQHGGGVFLTINRTEGGRRLEHIKEIRAVWLEWDHDEPLPTLPLAPHILVESSPNKYHCYWRTTDCSPDDHQRLMHCLVGAWRSDPSATDLVRTLRVPGFFHRKVNKAKGYRGEPVLTRLLRAEPLPPYATSALLAAFGVEAWEEVDATNRLKSKPSARTSGKAIPLNMGEVREALSFISPDERDVWLRVGMCLVSTRQPLAFTLWDDWSRQSLKYNEADQYRVWESFRENKFPDDDPERAANLGHLFQMARERGWKRDQEWTRGLLLSVRGEPLTGPANIALIVKHAPQWASQLRFNTFSWRIEYGEPQFDEYGRSLGAPPWSDTDDMRLADFLRAHHHMNVQQLSACAQAVEFVAQDHAYDPITTWLDGLPAWDEVDRLSHFFADFCQTEFTPYTAFCGTTLFLSLVARAYQPGCQQDAVIVLEGAEGTKKTSLCRLLGGPWYRAMMVSFESKDLFMIMRGAWVAELAELDAFARAGQNRIKGLLTILSDQYRPTYGRHVIDQPRRTNFIGTTNDPVYLTDPHGSRRFFPVQVGMINLEGVSAVLPQLFAEARHLYRAAVAWWTDDPEILRIAEEVRERVRESDPWEPLIGDLCRSRSGPLYMADFFGDHCLDVPKERRTRAMESRIGIILHRTGWTKKQRRNEAGQREYVYVKGAATPDFQENVPLLEELPDDFESDD